MDDGERTGRSRTVNCIHQLMLIEYLQGTNIQEDEDEDDEEDEEGEEEFETSRKKGKGKAKEQGKRVRL